MIEIKQRRQASLAELRVKKEIYRQWKKECGLEKSTGMLFGCAEMEAGKPRQELN